MALRRTGTGDAEVEMLAASLLAGEGKKQVEIAQTLGLSQAAVSRLLAEARGEYWCEEVRFLRDRVPDPLMERVFQRLARRDLAEHLDRVAQQNGQRGPLLRVFSCSATDVISRRKELSRNAAPYVKALILRSRICGVTWGGTLDDTVSALRALQIAPPWTKGTTIECVPLVGEPLGRDPMTFSSSSLAHDLGNLVNGSEYNALSLAMVPAFIPEKFSDRKDFSKAEVKGVWMLIGLVESYDLIFGRKDSGKTGSPMAERLDMVLTSVGPADRPLGFGSGRLFQAGSMTLDELQELIVGDVGGVCISKRNLKKGGLQKLESVRNRWTGLRIEHLNACAARAVDPLNGPPGVVVVSGGRARAQFICELVRRGLINHLIIDDMLAEELEKIVAAS